MSKPKTLALLLTSFLYAMFLLYSGCSHSTIYLRSDQDETIIKDLPSPVVDRLLILGDAGEPAIPEPVLLLLEQWASLQPEKTTVVFLGDNIYPAGLPNDNLPQYKDRKRRISAQVDVAAKSGARAIFTPGNHDWDNGRSNGLRRVINQEKFIESVLEYPSAHLPDQGCPGPSIVDLQDVRIIVIDTQWFLHKWEKPEINSCGFGTPDEFWEELALSIAGAGDREVIIAAHHPIISYGPHGGFYSWKDHLFPLTNLVDWLYLPLPVVGSLYPIGRWKLVKHRQDLNGSLYRVMADSLVSIMARNRPLIYASGHEHSLQLHEGEEGAQYYLVSGAGSQGKISEVGHGGGTLFAHSHAGFTVVDFLENGKALLRIVEPGSGIVYSLWLKG